MQKITVIIEDEPALEILQLAASMGPLSLMMEPVDIKAPKKALKRIRSNEDVSKTLSGKLIAGVIRQYDVGTEFQALSFMQAFEQAGLSPKSASPALSRMIEAGYLERVKPGVFRATHKAEELKNEKD